MATRGRCRGRGTAAEARFRAGLYPRRAEGVVAMRRRLLGIVLVVLAVVLSSCGTTRGQGPSDSPPARDGDSGSGGPTGVAVSLDFEGASSGRGAARFEPLLGEWVVRTDESAPSGSTVYAQTSTQNIVPPDTGADRIFGQEYSDYLDKIQAYQVFPSTIFTGGEYADVEVSVFLRPLSGRIDQSGGIIFRAASPKDYYIWRCNVLEQNCEMYIYENGDRRSVYQANVPLTVGEWRQIRVVVTGDRVQGFLDDRLLMDERFDTFDRGGVGLWTKADAITNFDEFVVTPR